MDKEKWKERLARYDDLISRVDQLERKGKTMPYTSDNGYMFSLLNKAGEIGIRFGKERQKHFIEAHQTTTYTSYGATMKGYVLIQEEMLKDLDQVAVYLKESWDYVRSLPPNESKKKK